MAPIGGHGPLRLQVSGIYQAGNAAAPYWWGINYFQFGNGTASGRADLDALFTDQQTLAGTQRGLARPTTLVEAPLATGKLHIGDLVGLRRWLLANPDLKVGSLRLSVSAGGLIGLLADAQHEQGSMTVIVAVADAELVLLALFVLYAVVSRASEAREHEVALARLRGARGLRVAAALLGEPVALLIVAGPLAVALSWITVRALAAPLLGADTQVSVSALAVIAAAVGMAGAVLAVVAASWSTLTRPLADQLRPAAHRRRRRWAVGAGEATAVVLAVAGLAELATSGVLVGGRADPIAAVAPALVMVAAGVIGARLVKLVCEVLVRPTRDRRWLACFLAVRQVAYRPTVVRQVMMVTVAAGLAAFAVAGWTVANRNWAEAAGFGVGAARVVTVAVPQGTDLESAVRLADPSGRHAMAVEQVTSPNGDLLAVDASRLKAVADWPAGLLPGGASAAARWLQPPTAPPVVIHGDQFRLDAALTDQIAGSAVGLRMTLTDSSFATHALAVNSLAAGARSYTMPVPAACAAGCELTTIGVTVRGGRSHSLSAPMHLQLSRPAQHTPAGWQSVPAAASEGAWRPSAAGWLVGQAAGGGIALAVTGSPGGVTPLVLTSRSLPLTIPVIMPYSETPALGPPGVPVQVDGLGGNQLNVNDALRVPVLPRISGNGPMVDLGLATEAQTSPDQQGVTSEVWLTGDAPASILRRLAADKITVTSTATAAGALAGYRHSGPALAYLLFPLAATAAAILVGLAILFTTAASFRQRAGELAGLWSSGVRRATLLRGLVIEQLLVLVFAVTVGVLAGLGSAALALPDVPEFVSTAGLPPPHYQPPAVALAAVLAGGLLIITAVAALSAVQVLRAIRPNAVRAGTT